MITPGILAESFSGNVEIVKLRAAGMTQEDNLIQLPFRANCMNRFLVTCSPTGTASS